MNRAADAALESSRKEPTGHVQTQEEIYYQDVAHEIMEAEQSHPLLSVSWMPRRASGGSRPNPKA